MTQKTPDLDSGEYATLHLALCQTETAQWDLDGNLERGLAQLRQAADHGAQLAITPECLFHGYADSTSEDFDQRIEAAAEPLGGERISRVQALCKQAAMACVLGFAERNSDGNIYNSAAFIAPDGDIHYVYRKVHCRPFEKIGCQGRFTPGDRFHSAPLECSTGTFQIGTMICFDREIPESVRCLRALGAQLVACPLATNTSRLDQINDQADNEMLTRVRAAENEVFIAVVNHAVRYNGGSFVVGPGGQVLVQLDEKPQVHLIDLPLGIVPDRYHADPLGWMGWGYRRPEVYNQHL